VCACMGDLGSTANKNSGHDARRPLRHPEHVVLHERVLHAAVCVHKGSGGGMGRPATGTQRVPSVCAVVIYVTVAGGVQGMRKGRGVHKRVDRVCPLVRAY